MGERGGPLDDAVRALAQERRRGLGDHPSPAQLAAYHAAELPAAQAERIEEHLALCAGCTRFLLDLALFFGEEGHVPEAPVAGRLSDEEMAAEWAALRQRVAGEEAGVREGAPTPWHRSVPVLRLLAASLALVAVALGSWTFVLRRAAREPRGDVQVVRPMPEGARGGQLDDRERFGTGPGLVVLELVLHPAWEMFASYTVEIAGPGRTGADVVWRSGALEPGQGGAIPVVIPGGYLQPGRYVVRLQGLGESGPEPVGEYEVEVRGDDEEQ